MPVSIGPSYDAKDQIKRAIDIVELVGDYIPLRREGRGYKGLCPWHDDARPSLQVNPERQSWKCWVCDDGGDVFSFVMKREGVSFSEALRILADRAGIVLEPRRGKEITPTGGQDVKRTLYQAHAWAEQQYHEFLLTAREADPARRYLAERGITIDSIKRFHLGFAPDSWDWLLKRGRETAFTPQVLETVGLVARRSSGGGHYDRFRGRVLFSIRDPQSRPVAFGGRVLPEFAEADAAKYINTSETPLFTKSSMLYGLDVARDTLAKSHRAIVMEGYTDAIIAQQFGFGDALAVLGTALGERHIKLLKRYVDRVVLVLDGDAAGQRRSNEVLELFVAEQVDLRVVTLPGGLDPCDFLLQTGPIEFRKHLENPTDALAHAFQTTTTGIDPDDVHAMDQALERLLAVVAKAPRLRADTTTETRLREQKILERLAFLFRVPEAAVRARLTDLRRKAQRKPVSAERAGAAVTSAAPGEQALGPVDLWERQLLEVLVQAPHLAMAILRAIRPEELHSLLGRELFLRAATLEASGVEVTFERLMLEFDDPAMKAFLVDLDERGKDRQVADPDLHLNALLGSFRRRGEDREHRLQAQTLRQAGLDQTEQERILREIIESKRNREGISVPTDG
jgi:DNA primase